MKYGLIGEKLPHSFSKTIHEQLGGYTYELTELTHEELGEFMTKREFTAINVTVPYKQDVIPYLYEMSDMARRIGAVNVVVNRDGKLYGDNTDYVGLMDIIGRAGITVEGKKVLILGTGGTSKTAQAVADMLGAREVLVVSRKASEGIYTYEEVLAHHTDADVIINTTPCGMFPKNDTKAIELSAFTNLSGVVDVVYNPLKTRLAAEAESLEIPATCGLYMLVSQAVKAYEIFLGLTETQEEFREKCDRIYHNMMAQKENIVLSGMPACGKSTVGKILTDMLGREVVDTDELIVEKAGMPIPEIFEKQGEKAFRDLESEAIAEVSKKQGLIISTGGGAILRPENITALKQNGRIYFIDRPLEDLVPTDDRPLSRDVEAIKKRFSERYDIYLATADEHIPVKGDAESVANEIKERFMHS